MNDGGNDAHTGDDDVKNYDSLFIRNLFSKKKKMLKAICGELLGKTKRKYHMARHSSFFFYILLSKYSFNQDQNFHRQQRQKASIIRKKKSLEIKKYIANLFIINKSAAACVVV